MAVFAGFVISLVWVCQIVLLFDFYRLYKTNQVTEMANTVINNIDNDDLAQLADRLSADNDICMLLLDGDGHTVISADHVRYCLLHRMSGEELARMADQAARKTDAAVELRPVTPFSNENYSRDNFRGAVPDDTQDRGMSLLYARQVSFTDGSKGTLLLNTQITPFSTTTETLRNQFIFIAACIAVAAGLMAFSMARSISQPMIETNEAARHLSHARYTRPPHSGGYREIAELNDTLVKAAEDLNRVDDLQKELIANISHDLRTPLTMIEGYAEVMRDIPEENTPENMQIVIDEVNRLSSLVNQILDFSRLQSGTMKLEKTDFNLTEEILSIVQRVSKMTAADGYTVVFDPEENVTVNADREAIGQVVYNLLGNALTYTGPDKTVRLTQQAGGSTVRISVADSGKGIAPDELDNIWNRYYRTKETHKRAVIGSGLGLNIVSGILERHEARYGVESEEGKGTTFWFVLPRVR